VAGRHAAPSSRRGRRDADGAGRADRRRVSRAGG
jgi:hypothetical protein